MKLFQRRDAGIPAAPDRPANAPERMYPDGMGCVNSMAWIASMPQSAVLHLYRKGRHFSKVPAVHVYLLEEHLIEEHGAGIYTVLPHYDGRFHPGATFRAGDLDRARVEEERKAARQAEQQEMLAKMDEIQRLLDER